MIESGGSPDGPAATIKLHHNVGGLPEDMAFELIEPLRDLFKDEVRKLGVQLGLPEDIVWRHPFPGPGLAVRCVGEVTKKRLDILREADAIVVAEIKQAGLYRQTAQAFAVLLPVQSVGVMGDARTYADVVAVRSIDTEDFMTADWATCLRLAGPHLDPHHQRGQGRQPRGVRHHQQAAGDDRVGVASEVWMSHGDQVSQASGDFLALAATDTCPLAAVKHRQLPIYGLQFHPEVTHTPEGAKSWATS